MNTLWTMQEALLALKEGQIVKVAELPILIKQKGDLYFLHHPNWHLKIGQTDLIRLFETQHFLPLEEREGIDEKKDEEYYRWRNTYL